MKRFLLLFVLLLAGCEDRTWVRCHGSFTPDSEAITVRRDSIKGIVQEYGRYCVAIDHVEGGQPYVVVDKEDEWKVK